MKKLLTKILAAIMVLSLTAACGSAPAPANPVNESFGITEATSGGPAPNTPAPSSNGNLTYGNAAQMESPAMANPAAESPETDSSLMRNAAAGNSGVSAGMPDSLSPDWESFNQDPSNPDLSNEEYLAITENPEKSVNNEPLLTFSLKVDTASYRNVVRYLNSGNLPPADAVRVEEMLNYFNYDEPMPENDTPFSVYTEVGPSPFNGGKEIAFVRVKSREIDRSEFPRCNFTFLIDTSGSMDSYDKLPLLKSSLALLVEQLTEDDKISIVTYSGSAGVLLDSVTGDRKDLILSAIDGLSAGGSTAGADGINTAYALAEKNFSGQANNRVLLATDGDFNVGVSSVDSLEQLIAEKRQSGIYLSVLGFGTENIKDNRMETLAKSGNGNYSYIDTLQSAQKTLVDELGGNLFTIANDVKAQIEFNPAQVAFYRLIGYENRMLANRDFNDDTKDAGEIGVGTDVVLMFEITRTGAEDIDLKYQQSEESQPNGQTEPTSAPGEYADELCEVKIRYKVPGESVSKLITHPVKAGSYSDSNTDDFNFAVSVAGFGHLLRNSDSAGDFNAARVLAMAKDSRGGDRDGYRQEFIELVEGYVNRF